MSYSSLLFAAWGTGIRGLTTALAALPQGKQLKL